MADTHHPYADKAVAAGAALLDAQYPEWFKAIDLEVFEISDGQRCVLGQVFKEVAVGRHVDGFMFAIESRQIVDDTGPYGFDEWYDNDEEVLYEHLQPRWVEEITRRQEGV